METYQRIQNRTGQTVAVVQTYLPTLKIAGVDAAGLLAQSVGLDTLAQARNDLSATYDQAANAEQQGFVLIVKMDQGLPASADAELDDDVPAELDLQDLLDPAYAIRPRTVEAAIERGEIVVSALGVIDPWLAAQVPPRGPITSGGRGLPQLTTALAAQPGLSQTTKKQSVLLEQGRGELYRASRTLDRLNKRFYKRLKAEALDNPALAGALGQIEIPGANLPGTLGLVSILQGGVDQLHLLVSYENGSGDGSTENTVEWLVAGVDADFVHSAPADPSGNALGPFLAGQTVKLRTRTRNSNGTTTGSVRTLTLLPPVV